MCQACGDPTHEIRTGGPPSDDDDDEDEGSWVFVVLMFLLGALTGSLAMAGVLSR